MNIRDVFHYAQRALLSVLMVGVACTFGCGDPDGGASSSSPQGGASVDSAQGGGTSADNQQSVTPSAPLSERPFDPSTVSTMIYKCVDAEESTYYLAFSGQGRATFSDAENDAFVISGTYSLSGETISINLPELGFVESAQDQRVIFGVIGAFLTPSLYCFAVALNGTASEPTQYICPSSNHIPDVSFEEDEFYFKASGNVLWRHWDNLVQVPDRIYAVQNGIWVQEGNRIEMFFGSPFFEPRVMTGTLANGTLLIDQLDTSNGACE